MERPWHASYPKGVSPEAEVDAYRSLVEIFDGSCERFADLPAFSNFGQTISYADLEARSRAFCRVSAKRAGSG